MKTLLTTFAALAAIYFCSPTSAQEIRIRPRVVIGQEIDGIGVIDDLQVSGSSSSSFSVTDQNGVKTTRVNDNGKKMEIVEDPASGITCKVTKNYGPNDLAKLEDEQPELFMHLSAIPKTVGESQVEINVGVTTTYTATDKDELETKHPEVYKLYAKYTKESAVGRIHLGFPRALRLRVGPEGAVLGEADDDDDADDDDEMDEDDDDSDDDDESDDDDSDDSDNEEDDDDGK